MSDVIEVIFDQVLPFDAVEVIFEADPQAPDAMTVIFESDVAVTVVPPGNISVAFQHATTTQDVTFEGIPGPRGLQGPPGHSGGGDGGPADQVTTQRIAAEPIGGHRLVTSTPDGRLQYASNLMRSDAQLVVWLTVDSWLTGELATVVTYGSVSEPSWEWIPNRPIYLADDGLMTQTLPASGFVLQVAKAITPTSLFFDPGLPIVIESN